ncbi:hypothetical protein P5G50_16280 [Leifsonia sp. F6_8S_P_1B]|uniref:Uncharacterized protein n=1 Tax=Leifsonia williamsii TaxID=3035919 RepID=A0ABT8KEX5_9MICO|nr:hypothetical protein [Leifsonia williamsii]MDN4616009.1 hypothetical protein [Leifsonia williamsii]
MTIENLSFEVTELVHLERSWERLTRKGKTWDSLAVELDYSVPKASYSRKRGEVAVETQYIFTAFDASIEDSAPLGKVTSRFAVVMRASREITELDVEQGALNQTTGLAHETSHPYHRMLIETMTREMGLPPFSLPFDFEGVAAMATEGDDSDD